MTRVVHAVLFVFTMLVAGACYAQDAEVAEDDESSIDQSFTVADRAALEAVLASEPAADLTQKQLFEFYGKQVLAAYRLGDIKKELTAAQKWLVSAGDDPAMQLKATRRLWAANVRGGDVSAGIAYGENVLERLPATGYSINRIRMQAALSNNYSNLLKLQRATELLDQAEKDFAADKRKLKPFAEYQRSVAQLTILSARTALLNQRGKTADAEVVARQAVVLAERGMQDQAKLGDSSKGDTDGQSKFGYSTALERLMNLQIAQAHFNDATVTGQTLLKFLRARKIGGSNLNTTYLLLSGLMLSKNDLPRAEFYARAVIKNTPDQSGNSVTRPGLSARNRLLDVLIVKRAWADALSLQNQLFEDIKGNEFAERLARRPAAQGLVLAYSSQPEKALALLKPGMDNIRKRLGEKHIETILVSGIYAIALAKAGKPEAALPLFENAMRDLRQPDRVGGAVSERGLQRAFRELILEEYIMLLATRSNDIAALDEAFRAAEYLRSSVVEQSVVESAVRAAASVAGLGDLVRVQQDMQSEFVVLQNFLTQQLSEPPQRQLPGVVTQVNKRIEALTAELAARHREITKRFPEYDTLINPQPPTTAGIGKRLAADEAYISVIPMSTRVAVFAVSTQSAALVMAKATPAELGGLAKRLRASLDIGDAGAGADQRYDAAAAYQLYSSLLAPVESVWKGKTRLSIAASGPFGQIPFGVLLTKPTDAGAVTDQAWLKSAPWLISQASISHIPSSSAWIALRDSARITNVSRATYKPFFGFGDPLFSSVTVAAPSNTTKTRSLRKSRSSVADITSSNETDLVSNAQYDKLPPLPETRDEINAIAKALGADPKRDAIFGKNASRQNVMSADLSKYKVVVFATHGLVAGDFPTLSQPALALSSTGNDAESPLLTLADVLRLKLDADWIVLSACNTAAADGEAAEAISGLGRGFFYAGAKALLVTHWAVETQSAMELTTATFQRFGENQTLSRAEALRQAQLGMIDGQRYAHPFYWASYALIGDGGR